MTTLLRTFESGSPLEVGGTPSTLATLALGQRARIVSVDEPGTLGERLLEMGLTTGTPIRVVRRSLFGNALQVAVRGYMLSLRSDQAGNIVVSA